MELNCKANEKIIKNLDERVKTLEEGGGGGGVSLTTSTDNIFIMLMTAGGTAIDASNIDNGYLKPNGEVVTELVVITQYGTQINLKPPILKVMTTDCTIVASKIRVTHTVITTPDIYKAIKEDNGSCKVTNYIFTSE